MTNTTEQKQGFVGGTANYLDERLGLGAVVKGLWKEDLP
jgi:hypothetical protein